MHTYLSFNVQPPPGATITGATLRLYTGSGSTLVGYQAYAVADTSWRENTITYANAPALGARLGTSGGWSTRGYKPITLPAWYIHSGVNSVGAATTAVGGKDFWSREAGSNTPQLVVSYTPASDTSPPSTPTGVAQTGGSATSISVNWNASTDNVGVTGYGLYRDGSLVGTTAATSYTFGGLTCSTSHQLAVDAYDAAGNRSAKATLTADTAACPDSSPPSTPTGLARTGATTTSISVNWNASTDNVGVTGYGLYRDGSLVGTTTATSYTFGGLNCSTNHQLAVDAYDAAGNRSTPASLAARTADCPATSYPLRGIYDRDLSSTGFSDEAAIGFNLLDRGPGTVDDLTGDLKGMVWVGNYNNSTCSWAVSDSSLQSYVTAHKGDPKVAVWYISDEPDPVNCPNAPAQHRARTALIHSIDPAAKVLVVLDSNSGQASLNQMPDWVGTADVYGLDPYPCYQGHSTCLFSWIDTVAAKADQLGLPYWGVVQAFGDPTGSAYSYQSLDSAGNQVSGDVRLPTADELHQEFVHWRSTHMRSYLVFAWRWPASTSSLWLANQPALLSQLAIENTASAPAPDSSPPSTPTGLAITGATTTSITVSWNASTDNVGVGGYGVYRNGSLVGTTAATSYTFWGLNCSTSYQLAVDAYDAAGNRSALATLTGDTAVCPPPASDPVITAAGDIAGSPTDSASTAALIGNISPTRVLTLGDNAMPDGTLTNFQNYYDPNWGRFKTITSPSPGNHDYHTTGGAGYFTYFGAQAPAEYYSYDLGAWHLISLDGEISHSAGSAQEQWLKADLAAHPNRCTLAYWHEPRFSSGSVHGSNTGFDAFWRDLYNAGAEVVLNGHDHDYERFAPQTPDAQADPVNGIREFVVGTGGNSLYSFGTPVANSEVRGNSTFGVIKITLHPTSYDWNFVPTAGHTFTDSGTQPCH